MQAALFVEYTPHILLKTAKERSRSNNNKKYLTFLENLHLCFPKE